jgi:cold shock CspA family protein
LTHGRVAEYDDHKGYGYIERDDQEGDGERLFFHCTAIADGSRTIPVGAGVTFEIVAGRMGREATNVSCAEHRA